MPFLFNKESKKSIILSAITTSLLLLVGCTDTSKDADEDMADLEKMAMSEDSGSMNYDSQDASTETDTSPGDDSSDESAAEEATDTLDADTGVVEEGLSDAEKDVSADLDDTAKEEATKPAEPVTSASEDEDDDDEDDDDDE